MFNSSSILCVFFLKKISYWFSKVMIEKRHLTKYLTVCSSFIRARLTFCCSCFCKISSLFLYFCLSCLFVKLNQAIILSHWSCELVRWGCWGTANLLIPVLYFANVVRLWFPHKWYISTNAVQNSFHSLAPLLFYHLICGTWKASLSLPWSILSSHIKTNSSSFVAQRGKNITENKNVLTQLVKIYEM